MSRSLRLSTFLLMVLVPPLALSAQARISELDRNDPVYIQHQQMVADFHAARARGDAPPALALFRVTPPPGVDLFDLSARLMLPYATIATLNRLDSPSLTGLERPLLVPNQPGLFVPEVPVSQLERRLTRRTGGADRPEAVRIVVPGTGETFAFLPGRELRPDERDLFLRVRFEDPLPGGRVSSRFGYRRHPVTGVGSMHYGIDLASDYGTPVVAAADGTVMGIDRDPWLGLSVRLAHRGGYETRYAHLQESLVRPGQSLTQGAILGYVGSTGLSTGPHLHFEIRYRSEARDPEQYISWQ